jgi:hypothetical protein
MLRLILSVCSALILVLSYFWLAGVPITLAAEESILAPGDPPLTRDVSDASAEVSVFMLKVVATGTASAANMSLDGDLLDVWADALRGDYRSMSSDEQHMLAGMPLLRGALREAWPQASASERATLREAFRPIAEGWLAGMSCDSFVSLADAGYVEKTQANVQRYTKCDVAFDDADLDLEDDVVERTLSVGAAAPGPVAAAAPAAAASVASESPTAAYQRASAGLAASHNMYTHMSNVLLENHVGNMNAILNMGNNDYHYVYKSTP